MAKANTHLTHLEELVLTQGPAGYKMARAFLLELLKTLKGNTGSKIQTSVKWDGAPAIFAGVNPENGKFFVGTKSIFNKVPKINYTKEDIIKNHGHAPGLVDKLTKALEYLPALNIKNILQGDFMFDDEMISTVEIDGEPHYKFKPNTIVYAVPVDSELGRQIEQAKFGIVFHTTYDSLDSGASFGADISGLRRAPGVWFDDAFFTDDTGVVTLTEDEEAEIVRLVKEADAVNNEINYDDLPFAFLNIYINSEIKAGSFLEDPAKSFQGFVNWYSQRAQKKINNLKSDKGRQRATQNAQQTLQSFNERREDILNIFKVSRLLFDAKNIFIEKYNNAVYNTKHFVDDGSGDLVVSNPEGYVAVDHKGNGIKFVDRLEFSRANFAVDKGDKFTGDINEQEDEFDIGDEDDDPVVDADYPKTVAVVPGAFKPPHKGHLDMVRKYANVADEVIVLISKPTKKGRYLPNGREITSDDSLKIWNVLTAGLSNVKVEISSHASPINAAYEYVGEEGPLNIGDKVMLGCSTKGGDCGRWAGAEKYIKQGVELIPVTGVEPTVRASGEPYSATAFRNALGGPLDNRAEIADFVGEENLDAILDILGLANVEETSSMAGGAVAGASIPLGSTSGKGRRKAKQNTIIRHENIDLSIVETVLELIKERGII
mgnify:CR=1 FL=1|tara:strand:+ start:697 stop:2673 length:1977 start_codon:yes stop_codon:yes gene_type:complete